MLDGSADDGAGQARVHFLSQALQATGARAPRRLQFACARMRHGLDVPVAPLGGQAPALDELLAPLTADGVDPYQRFCLLDARPGAPPEPEPEGAKAATGMTDREDGARQPVPSYALAHSPSTRVALRRLLTAHHPADCHCLSARLPTALQRPSLEGSRAGTSRLPRPRNCVSLFNSCNAVPHPTIDHIEGEPFQGVSAPATRQTAPFVTPWARRFVVSVDDGAPLLPDGRSVARAL